MVNEHIVNYHPSPSELTSRIHPLIFLWTPEGYISPEYLLNFFSNLFTPPWFRKSFKFMVLRLLENIFVSQKLNLFIFFSCPQAKFFPKFLSSPLQTEWNYSFFPNSVFWKSIFPQQKGEAKILWSWKKWPKLNLRGNWSQVLNSTILATFRFLVSVLLWHNLDSSMLKCEGSLTHLIFTKKHSVQEWLYER